MHPDGVGRQVKGNDSGPPVFPKRTRRGFIKFSGYKNRLAVLLAQNHYYKSLDLIMGCCKWLTEEKNLKTCSHFITSPDIAAHLIDRGRHCQLVQLIAFLFHAVKEMLSPVRVLALWEMLRLETVQKDSTFFLPLHNGAGTEGTCLTGCSRRLEH